MCYFWKMSTPRPTYPSAFGLLQAEAAPDNQFVWKGDFNLGHPLFSGTVPVCLFTTEERFQICDHYGIAVSYRFTVPVSVDNLEDSEPPE